KIKAAEASKVICPKRGKERANKAREAVAIARMIRRLNSAKRWSRANPPKGLLRIKAKKTISRKAVKEKELSRIQTSLTETKKMKAPSRDRDEATKSVRKSRSVMFHCLRTYQMLRRKSNKCLWNIAG